METSTITSINTIKPQKIDFFTKLIFENVFPTNLGTLSLDLAIKIMWHNDFTCHQSTLGPD